MASYRIKYSIYRVTAETPQEAKRKIVNLMQTQCENWISVELDTAMKPLWKQFLFGR